MCADPDAAPTGEPLPRTPVAMRCVSFQDFVIMELHILQLLGLLHCQPAATQTCTLIQFWGRPTSPGGMTAPIPQGQEMSPLQA